MGFFDSLARWIIGFVKGSWVYMKKIAGVIINSTFGLYTGQPISEEICALILFGGVGAIVVIIIILKKGMAIKG